MDEAEFNESREYFDEFRDALIGMAGQPGRKMVDAYDYDKCIKILVEDGYSLESAIDYLDVEIANDWGHDADAPIFVELKRIPNEPPLP